MSRTFHDMSPAEQNAYRVYQSKLADRTLPASEHDRIRKEIDSLLWKGPNAKVQSLAKEVADLSAKTAAALNRIMDRIERLEFHAGLTADGVIGVDHAEMARIINGPPGTVASTPFPRPTMADEEFGIPAKAIPPFGEGLQVNIMPVSHEAVSVPAPTDPFDLPEYRTSGPLVPGLAPCGQFAVDPHPSDASPTPDEKKTGRGRPKGAKNKPKSPPVASGEGKEQPATTVAEGVVTAVNPSFTDRMAGAHDPEGEWEGAEPTDDFWQS